MASYNNNFLDWYKQNYNADYDPNKGYGRVDSISDQDWEVGNNLFNAYTRKNDLTNQMNSSQATMDANKTKQQQMASIQLDKLKKYLPTQIKAQGLGGLGVSESSMLQANNSYQNAMGNIDGDYNKSQMDLLNSYNSNVSAIDEEQTNRNQGIFDKYTEIERVEKEKADELARLEKEKADQIERDRLETERITKEKADTEYYNELTGSLQNMLANTMPDESGRISAADKKRILDFANSKMSSLSPERQNLLNVMLSGIESRTDEEDSTTEANKKKQDIIKTDIKFNNNGGWWIFGATDLKDGDNFSVKLGDKKYRIESGGEVSDPVMSEKAAGVDNQSVFGYKEQLYYKVDGKIYLVKKRANSYGDHYSELYGHVYNK